MMAGILSTGDQLSVQQVLDCSHGDVFKTANNDNLGCWGGNPDDVFKYVMTEGLVAKSDYRKGDDIASENLSCKDSELKGKKTVNIEGFKILEDTTVSELNR